MSTHTQMRLSPSLALRTRVLDFASLSLSGGVRLCRCALALSLLGVEARLEVEGGHVDGGGGARAISIARVLSRVFLT